MLKRKKVLSAKRVFAVIAGTVLLSLTVVNSFMVEAQTDVQEYKYELYLYSDVKKVSTNDEDPMAYFYVETDFEGEYITLMNADTNEPIAKLLDDGKYSVSWDDLPSDGVYSNRLYIDNSEQNIFSYYAMAEDGDGTISISNTIQIKVYKKLTQKDFSDMEAVDIAISTLQQSDAYLSMTYAEQCAAMEELLYQLAETGTKECPYSLIQKDTITFSEGSSAGMGMYLYQYACGVMSGVQIEKTIVTETTATSTTTTTQTKPTTTSIPTTTTQTKPTVTSIATTTQTKPTATSIATTAQTKPTATSIATTAQTKPTATTTSITTTQTKSTTTFAATSSIVTTEPMPPILSGDVNLDGSRSIADAVMLQKYLLAVDTLTEMQWNAADVIDKGIVNGFDLAVLKQMLISGVSED